MKSVLFYSDADKFGGHEALTLEAVRCLCQDKDISVSIIFYEGNDRFGAALRDVAASTGRLTLVPSKFQARNMQAFRSLISVKKVASLKRTMKSIAPDLVVISQGRIESGTLGLLAAKRAGLRAISYIPMAHSVSVSGKPVALRIREIVNAYFYRLPDKFITISESARGMLMERGASTDIVVVPNGIHAKPLVESDRHLFRDANGITPTQWVVGVIGRIEFRQKAQDFAVNAIDHFRHRLPGFRFVFVGEGPDEPQLKAMIAAANLSPMVQILPWHQDPAKLYAGLDMLLISSRFEGVPLVMLEAMFYRLPIVASNTDGMAEFLPQSWLFPFGDEGALVDQLLRVREADNSRFLDLHRKQAMEDFSIRKFCMNMSAAISERTPSQPTLWENNGAGNGTD